MMHYELFKVWDRNIIAGRENISNRNGGKKDFYQGMRKVVSVMVNFIGVISKVIKSNKRHLKSNKECTFVKLFVSFILTFC